MLTLGAKARSDERYFLEQRYHLGGGWVHVRRAEEHSVKDRSHFELVGCFIPNLHWGDLLEA